MPAIFSMFELLDPGYWFDILSIYEIKKLKFPTQQNNRNWENLCRNLRREIGDDYFWGIWDSGYYGDLFKANQRVFELVDLAKKDEIKASEVDFWNHKRYLCKTALQAHFFPNLEVTEVKIGYNK